MQDPVGVTATISVSFLPWPGGLGTSGRACVRPARCRQRLPN